MDRANDVLTLDTCLDPGSPYCFGDGIVHQFPAYLKRHEFDRCYLVSSGQLLKMFGTGLLAAMSSGGVRCEPVLISDTEPYKNWQTLRLLCEKLTAEGATKDSILIALGGGVIGNIVGLAAGLIFRGIRFVQVPTTVTAQTDSTLSNKQAINGAMGKNQFGVYHAPLFVWADASYPRSEPVRQQKSGIVEGIKNVLISHESVGAADAMLDLWESADRFPELLLSLIRSKLAILEKDPSERGSAIILEYGHTFGHAIEWLSQGKLLHGEAVAIGICLAAELSHALGFQSRQFLQEHHRLLGGRLQVPTMLPGDLSPGAIYQAMLADNKRTARGLRFLLLKACGQFVNPDGDYMVSVERRQVLQCLASSQQASVAPSARKAV